MGVVLTSAMRAPLVSVSLLAFAACSSAPEPSAPEGTLGGACYGNGTCNSGLVCRATVCVLDGPRDGGGDADRDGGTGADRDGGSSADRDGGTSTDGGVDPTRDGGEAPAPAGCFSGGPTVRDVSRRAAAFDSNGVAHVALGGDAVRYARHDTNGWTIEVVDPHGDIATLALASDGQPVIAYFDRHERHAPLAPEVHALKVARRRTDGGWTVDTIDPEVRRSDVDLDAPQVAVLPSGVIFVAAREGEGILTATYDGGWTIGTVDIGTARYVRFLEVAVDVLGAPMLGFSDFTSLFVVRHVDGAWRTPEVVSAVATAPQVSAFFADAAGRPSFIVYLGNVRGERLKVLRETGAGWDVQTCTGYNNGRLGYAPALLPDGTLGFGFFDYVLSSNGFAPAAMSVGATCESEVVGTPDAVRYDSVYLLETSPMSRTGIAFAAGATERLLVYLDLKTQEVVASLRDASGTWTHEALTRNGLRGYSAAIAIDADGRPVVAGIELSRQTLELSRHDGTGFVTEVVPIGDPSDDCEVLDYSPGAVDVAVHGTGDILVAYSRDCPMIGRQVVLSRRASFGWTLDVVESSAGVSALRLALDPDGRPALVYGSRLHEYDGTQWVAQSITGLQGVGDARPSLAYDGLGRAVVAHVENRDIAVAFRDAAGQWAVERIESIYYGGGMHTALAIDADGVYHVAYSYTVRDEPDRVRYARKAAAAWTFETIEPTTSSSVYGVPAGLDIGLVGTSPVVAFHSHTAQTARIARRDANGWNVTDLVTDGDTGWFPSLAVDANDVVHAAFHHRAASDLCYTRSP